MAGNFVYHSDTGKFYSPTGAFLCIGYSGTGEGRDNPALEDVPDVGPIPRGQYTIGAAHTEPVLGPVVMNLDPDVGTQTFGRSLFRIHGDDSQHDASHGCIILPPWIRKVVADSDVKTLDVV